VEGNTIKDILPGRVEVPGAVEVVDVPGDHILMAGLVDSHVHINEPGRTAWEGFDTATRAAAVGGVTTLVDMPLNALPPTTSPENLATKVAAARGQCWVDVGFWGGVIPGNAHHLKGGCGLLGRSHPWQRSPSQDHGDSWGARLQMLSHPLGSR